MPGELERAKQANEELLHACIALGGSVTGEHGVGLDKAENLPLQFAEADLELHVPAAARLRSRRDLMNPGKLLPVAIPPAARVPAGAAGRAGRDLGLSAPPALGRRARAAAAAPGDGRSGALAAARAARWTGVAAALGRAAPTVDDVSRVLALASPTRAGRGAAGRRRRARARRRRRAGSTSCSLARLDAILEYSPTT